MANNKNLKKELPKYGSSWWLPRILGLSYRVVHLKTLPTKLKHSIIEDFNDVK